jgi:hypothetical protein
MVYLDTGICTDEKIKNQTKVESGYGRMGVCKNKHLGAGQLKRSLTAHVDDHDSPNVMTGAMLCNPAINYHVDLQPWIQEYTDILDGEKWQEADLQVEKLLWKDQASKSSLLPFSSPHNFLPHVPA